MKKEAKIMVIIVDDHPLIRETWSFILSQDKRIQVIGECSSGAEAIESAKKLRPDIMLMDINMSPINGLEATNEITKCCPETKVIGISINNQTSYVRNMLKKGAKGFVTKDAPQQEMIDAIVEVSRGNIYLCKDVRRKLNSHMA
jgi:DNA-binding NarL/FixJ family response regulator